MATIDELPDLDLGDIKEITRKMRAYENQTRRFCMACQKTRLLEGGVLRQTQKRGKQGKPIFLWRCKECTANSTKGQLAIKQR